MVEGTMWWKQKERNEMWWESGEVDDHMQWMDWQLVKETVSEEEGGRDGKNGWRMTTKAQKCKTSWGGMQRLH